MKQTSFKFDIIKNMAFNEEDPLIMAQLKGYYEFKQLYEAGIREVLTKLKNLEDEFSFRFDHKPIHHLESRFKEPMSIINKLKSRQLEVSMDSAMENLEDIAGVRVISPYVDDVYLISELLVSQDDIRLIRQSDYIKEPKDNGYRSIHLIVEVPIYLTVGKRYVKVEIQLRTVAMDFWASLEHDIRYKKTNLENRDDLLLRLKLVAQKIHLLDKEMMKIFHDSRFDHENE